MAISVLATLVGDDADDAEYDLVGDPHEPAVRVTVRWTGERVEVVGEVDGRGFVGKGLAAVAVERARQGVWPPRVVRIS